MTDAGIETTTITIETPPEPDPGAPGAVPSPPGEVPAEDGAGDDLAAVRALALRAHPDAVPELVGGGTVAEVLASVEGARAAYRRIVDGLATAPAGGGGRVPAVPAGAAPAAVADPDALPSAEKIKRGLAGRSRQ